MTCIHEQVQSELFEVETVNQTWHTWLNNLIGLSWSSTLIRPMYSTTSLSFCVFFLFLQMVTPRTLSRPLQQRGALQPSRPPHSPRRQKRRGRRRPTSRTSQRCTDDFKLTLTFSDMKLSTKKQLAEICWSWDSLNWRFMHFYTYMNFMVTGGLVTCNKVVGDPG